MAKMVSMSRGLTGHVEYVFECTGCGKHITMYKDRSKRTAYCGACLKARQDKRFKDKRAQEDRDVYNEAVEDCIDFIEQRYSIYNDLVYGIINELRGLKK